MLSFRKLVKVEGIARTVHVMARLTCLIDGVGLPISGRAYF